MIWRWLTCSDVTLARLIIAFALAAAAAGAATVSGSVDLRDSRVEAVRKHRDYSGIVISLQPVDQPVPPPPAKHVVMNQKNKMFIPHVLPILTGTVVDFPNSDPIFHNAFSSFSGQIFDVGLYPPGSSRSVRFQRAGVVRVFCNIHPSMSAVILVLNTQWFTTTKADGSFELDVPPGSYDLSVFHERATEQSLRILNQRILVNGQPVKLPVITVSEAGYLMAPHKNKYGKEYSEPQDQVVYPGARN